MIDMLEKERKALEKGGLNVKRILASLKRLQAKVLKLAAEQEASKRRTIDITKELNKWKHELYVDASGALDMSMGAVDKDSIQAKGFQRMRSRIRRPRRSKKTPDQPATGPEAQS